MNIIDGIHLNIPKVLTNTFRILPKYCRKFIPPVCREFMEAIEEGISECPQGFRIFRQYTYEWYEPLNIEVAKIAEKKKWEKI